MSEDRTDRIDTAPDAPSDAGDEQMTQPAEADRGVDLPPSVEEGDAPAEAPSAEEVAPPLPAPPAPDERPGSTSEVGEASPDGAAATEQVAPASEEAVERQDVEEAPPGPDVAEAPTEPEREDLEVAEAVGRFFLVANAAVGDAPLPPGAERTEASMTEGFYEAVVR
ncbi:MAG TPA: hypothetical protein VHL78_01985, partial [Actinomycetota bacterium]|nr:hypothetical protein [Actinomycetota bacterium]